jgi:hypothetical protein
VNDPEVNEISVTVKIRDGVGKISSQVVERATMRWLADSYHRWVDYCIENKMSELDDGYPDAVGDLGKLGL